MRRLPFRSAMIYSNPTSPMVAVFYIKLLNKLFYYFKEKYASWEKPYIRHLIIEYDLYPHSLVNSQV